MIWSQEESVWGRCFSVVDHETDTVACGYEGYAAEAERREAMKRVGEESQDDGEWEPA